MKRKDKREIARRLANLEKRYQRATTDEERKLLEDEMTDITMNLVDGLSEDTFNLDAISYIDNYVQQKLKS